MKTDKEFLLWLADRLVLRLNESPNKDYIKKLVSIAHAYPENKYTPVTSKWSGDDEATGD